MKSIALIILTAACLAFASPSRAATDADVKDSLTEGKIVKVEREYRTPRVEDGTWGRCNFVYKAAEALPVVGRLTAEDHVFRSYKINGEEVKVTFYINSNYFSVYAYAEGHIHQDPEVCKRAISSALDEVIDGTLELKTTFFTFET